MIESRRSKGKSKSKSPKKLLTKEDYIKKINKKKSINRRKITRKNNRNFSLGVKNLVSINSPKAQKITKISKKKFRAFSSKRKDNNNELITLFSKKSSTLGKRKNSNKRSKRSNQSSFITAKSEKVYNTETELKKQVMFDEYLKAAQNQNSNSKKKKPLFFQKSTKLAPLNELRKRKSEKEEEDKKPKGKKFITSKAYKCIRQGLLDRGWIENPVLKSDDFDLKFCVKIAHINFSTLKKNQFVNHFLKAPDCLTTKVGLSKTLKNLYKYSNDESESFFPRCFYSIDEEDFKEFIRYYKFLHAENILKKFLNLALRDKRDNEEYQILLNEKLETAITVIKRRLKLNFGEFFSPENDDFLSGITSEEWSILAKDDINPTFINLLKEPEKVITYIGSKFSKEEKAEMKKKRKKTKKKTVTSDEDIEDKYDLSHKIESLEGKGNNLNQKEKEVRKLLEILKSKFPQTGVNGCSNIWILKPAGLSRGRGIRLYSNIKTILNHLKSSDYAWVVQKYLENSLLYNKKKLDIRQWVLVTDFEPLTIWFYEECYVRISSAEFSLGNLKDRYIHLTNNSVNKKADNFVKEEGFMSQQQMIDFLGEKYSGSSGEEMFGKIQQRMKNQVKKSLLCCQESVVNRKNSCSIYGYDFCIDEDLGVWLIEVNASPDFSFSSDVTERLVKMASDDFLKVVLDYGNAKSKKKKKNMDTGLFKLIYKAKNANIDFNRIAPLKLSVVGTKLPAKKYKKVCKNEDTRFEEQNDEIKEGDMEI